MFFVVSCGSFYRLCHGIDATSNAYGWRGVTIGRLSDYLKRGGCLKILQVDLYGFGIRISLEIRGQNCKKFPILRKVPILSSFTENTLFFAFFFKDSFER